MGGNPGLADGTYNNNLVEMTILDPCSQITPDTFIALNELTTVAAVFTHGQYMSNYQSLGLTRANAISGLRADNNFRTVVNSSSGVTPGPLFNSTLSFPFDKLGTLANIIASCADSAGGIAGDKSPCGDLFSLTTPLGGVAPTDLIGALLSIQRNPLLHTLELFNLSSAFAPYQPSLSSAPPDWYMRVATGPSVTPRYFLCRAWGDSLTAGNQDLQSDTYVDSLAQLSSCYQSDNNGVPGQTSTQIGVREGGVLTTATVVGGQIPESGPVQITFPSGYEPITPSGPTFLPIILSGVEGLVEFDYSIYGFDFFRITTGPAVSSPQNSPFQIVNGNQNADLVIFWAGRNNVGDTNQILADIAAMVASVSAGTQYLILSVPNNTTDPDWIGNYEYNWIIALNQTLASTYPGHYLDVRTPMVAAYDPNNPEDVIDHGNDTIPSSLRAVSFTGSLTSPLADSGCSLHATGSVYYSSTIMIDNEKILIKDSDGNNAFACVRGYAGTTAAAHAINTTFTASDGNHYNAKGYGLVAHLVDQWAQTH